MSSNTQSLERTDSRESTAREDSTGQQTTVTVRCTGHVRTEIGNSGFNFTFEGSDLREFLTAFFEEYPVQEMLIAKTEAEATTRGWAPEMEELPGNNYAKNPEGEQTRRYARVVLNGIFNEHLDGLDTELSDGDRISLIYPFMYCC